MSLASKIRITPLTKVFLIAYKTTPAAEWLLGVLLETIQTINQRDPNLAEKFVAGLLLGIRQH